MSASTADAVASDAARVERRLQALVRSWGLSRFSEQMAMQWLVRALGASAGDSDRGNNNEDELARLRTWLLQQLNGQRRPPDASPWQHGCPELLPALRAFPAWDCDALPWVRGLERAFPAIKRELLALRSQPRGFQPYRAPSWASDLSVRHRRCC